MSDIAQAINRKFEEQKIIIWLDSAQEFMEDFETLELPGNVQKLRVDNNEFGVKHTVFTASDEQKFLIYRSGLLSHETENWLLDLELAYGIFTADKISLTLNALGISSPIAINLASQHPAFFGKNTMLQQLKLRLTGQEDEATFKAKMVACILGLPEDQHSMQVILSHLMTKYAQGDSSPQAALAEYGLEEFFWKGTRNIYRYPEDTPENFGALLIWAYRDEVLDSTTPEYRNIRTDYKAFRDNYSTRNYALKIAQNIAENKNYYHTHKDDALGELLPSVLFEETEQLILLKLTQGLLSALYSAQEISELVAQRSLNSVLWYQKYREAYETLVTGAQLLERIRTLELGAGNLVETFKNYIYRWSVIDRLYRKYHLAQKRSSQVHGNTLFNELTQQVNNAYTSNYLIPLGDHWSNLVDKTPNWRESFPDSNRQEAFYTEHVKRHLEKARTFVIISDGMRYEAAHELEQKLAQNDKYKTSISGMLGVLPSYTQLGMASLLPHTKLTITPTPDSASVLADGVSTQGTANRNKILTSFGGRAFQYKDVISLSRADMKELFKDLDCIYIYHNTIDSTGDKRATEDGTFAATEIAFQEIETLVRKLHTSATRILITADHGFIYQDENDNQISYLSEKAHGDTLIFEDRRFVFGKGLHKSEAFHHFTSQELGVEPGVEVLIPRSVQRLKRQGSGFRYVHGGASLQEITVPVINVHITKNKSISKTVKVDFVEVPSKLTSNLLVIKLVQQQPLGNLQPLRVRAGIYHNDNLISDQPEATFNFAYEATSERQLSLTLELTRAADSLTEGNAEIRLESYNSGTETWHHYEKTNIEIKRGNTAIDDFFN